MISNDGQHTYTGSTSNVVSRLDEHNSGRVKSSRPYIPYEVVCSEELETLKEVRRRESFYKSTTVRRGIKRLLGKRLLVKE